MPLKIGFTFVPMPQEIWDECWDMTQGEFRLLGYIIRHTIGFRNETIRLTDDEIINGRKSKDGSGRIDKGCGLSLNSMKQARKRLLERDAIAVDGNKNYWANLDTRNEKVLSTSDTSGCQTLIPKVSTSDTSSLYNEERQSYKTNTAPRQAQLSLGIKAEEQQDPLS